MLQEARSKKDPITNVPSSSTFSPFWTTPDFGIGIVPFVFYFPQAVSFVVFFLQTKTCSFDCNIHFFTVNPTFVVWDYNVHKCNLHINMNWCCWSHFRTTTGKNSSRNLWQSKEVCAHRIAPSVVLSLLFFC